MEELDVDRLLKSSRSSEEIVVNDFNESSAQKFRDEVLEAAKGDALKPIVIYIDSYGGHVDSLAKMIETMDEVPNPTVTVCIGKAASCGAILLSHGDIRFIGRHSRVMVHEASGGAAGDVHDVNADAQELKRLNKHFLGILAKNCGIKGGYDALRKMIKDMDGRDNYMGAKEALTFGIADHIGMPRVNKLTLYQVDIIPEKLNIKDMPAKKTKAKKSETNR